MPVRKFRDVGEMEDAIWRDSKDATLPAAIARVWEFAARTCARRFPPGVHKHRSIEEAQQLREEWDAQNFRRFWQQRGPTPFK